MSDWKWERNMGSSKGEMLYNNLGRAAGHWKDFSGKISVWDWSTELNSYHEFDTVEEAKSYLECVAKLNADS